MRLGFKNDDQKPRSARSWVERCGACCLDLLWRSAGASTAGSRQYLFGSHTDIAEKLAIRQERAQRYLTALSVAAILFDPGRHLVRDEH